MGSIIKIAKTIVKTADRITMHATNGDICLNAAKSVNFSSKDKIEFGNYNPPELENTDKLLVTKVEGPDTIALGKKQDFKATRFSRPVADPRELEKVKWAYQLDDEEIVKLDTPGRILGKTVVKKIDTPNSWKKHKTLKVYAYIESPSEKVSIKSLIKVHEKIFIVGTEQYANSYGNKMMFPAQAIREVRENAEDLGSILTIVMFTDGFNQEELSTVEKDGKALYSDLNFVKINSVSELINYLNSGMSLVSRENVSIKEIKIFSHGEPSVLSFGYEGRNKKNQEFKISHLSKLKKEVFLRDSVIYSYACRTGNSDDRKKASLPTFVYDEDWESIVKPQESLAQKLADYLDITVFAYLRRTLYTATWDDKENKDYTKDYKEIDDETINGWRNPRRWFVDWDEALWHPRGAYALPTVGSTPKGLPRAMYKFQKGKIPNKVN